MTMIKRLAGALLLGAGALGLAGCATGLPTQVSRYQAMPAAAGQTFHVEPAEGAARTLEFNRYAALVAQHLQARGYTAAASPQLATMVVRLDYGVDEGTREDTVDPFARSRYGYGYGGRFADPFYRGYYDPFYRSRFGYGGYYDPFYGPYYGRPIYSRYGGYWGARSPFYYGWDDPFWYSSPYAGYGAGYREPIRSYTVYKSYLDLDIVRKADNAPLFEGKAKARSQTDETGVLIPNLIEAMFTGFPGKSGETIRITVPARKGS
ncbi:MAG TPA: DUF4136 domain-containing protein [Sphingomicrobium sp.]|nr:DUF4136 domain-containing protein [Sphingomicrobium sp.]